MKKIAFFEEISFSLIPIVNDYLNNGFSVYYLSIEGGIKEQKNIKKYLETGRFINISQIVFNNFLYSHAAFYAHKNLEQVFNKYFSNSRLIKITCGLFKSPEIQNMYKKELLNYLEKIYITELKLNEIAKDNSGEIYFYPIRNYNMYSDDTSLLFKNIKIIEYKNYTAKIVQFCDKLYTIMQLFYPLYILFKKTKFISIACKAPKKLKFGLNVNLPSLFGYNYHYINFIVDDIYGYPKNDILFIHETYETDFRNECEKRSYSCIDSKKKEILSLCFLNKLIKTFSPAWIKCLCYSFSEEIFIVRTTRIILTDYIKWNIFVECYSISTHISILLPDNISKNLILSSNNIKTWYIYPDNSGDDYCSEWWINKQPTSVLFSFIASLSLLYNSGAKFILSLISFVAPFLA